VDCQLEKATEKQDIVLNNTIHKLTINDNAFLILEILKVVIWETTSDEKLSS